MVVVEFSDVGPFRDARIELKPLTLLIGKNCVGKSLLLYMLWVLASTMPSFEHLFEHAVQRGAREVVKSILEAVREGKCPRDEMLSLASMLVEALPEAIARGLQGILGRVFGVPLSGIVRVGARQGKVRVHGKGGAIEFVVSRDSVDGKYLDIDIKLLEEKLNVKVLQPGLMKVSWGDEIVFNGEVLSVVDVLLATTKVVSKFVFEVFGWMFRSAEAVVLFVDGRAGLARTLLKPYIDPSMVKGILYPDEQYIRMYYRLAEELAEGNIWVEMLDELLRELGVGVETVLERGTYVLKVKTWSGIETSFENAPSGIREVLTLALSLASMKEPYVVFAEEPEAHLHPKAQKILAKLIARSINTLGKTVVLTTHSDYLVYTFNNLIALSRAPEYATKLGYHPDDVLNPNKVSAYLVKPVGDHAEVEQLRIDEEGIDEESFAQVARELADEKAEILLARVKTRRE